ncbi:MAG TPA: efflux RND transporter periplasmic adaptor subunit [Polyangiaceae bacterium]
MTELEQGGEGPEPPPRGTRTMTVVRWALVVLSVVIAAAAWWSFAGSEPVQAERYQCPMHPQVVSDRPGECPICHMDLEPVSESRSQTAATKPKPAPSAKAPVSAPAEAKVIYSCPMHPQIRSDAPGRCPICKMPLERQSPSVEDAGASAASDGEPSLPGDVAPIELALDRAQAIGVRTALAESLHPDGKLRVSAVIEAPERQTARVHVRSAGFVERIAVKDTGVRVQRGQELVAVYSPELFQAQSELLLAKSWGAADRGAATLEQAQGKLELLGMSRAQIAAVLAKNEAVRAISISAPVSGTVVAKNVVLGSYVTPDVLLYEIVDLSSVYLVADVYERDLSQLTLGSAGRFFAPGQSEPVARVQIDLVYPSVASDVRARRVRMLLANPKSALAPGQSGFVEFDVPAQRSGAVWIPRDALIDTGLATYVFVSEGEGRYAPRAVVVAGEQAHRIEIARGLSGGERVVSGATFLIDSESRLQAALAPKPSRGAEAGAEP